jgi:glycogen debranching enzyme
MAPDMFSGWGIRTLSSECPAYNPMGYHLGTVWPHDNALAAAGFKRYGFQREMLRTVDAMFEVAARVPDFRLPELYCGFQRGHMDRPVAYPVACSPQAWAAAAPFMMLQAMLGISPRAPDGVLTVNEPQLPDWLDHVELRNLRIASSTVGLSFRADADTTAFSLLEQKGDARVVMSSAPPAS